MVPAAGSAVRPLLKDLPTTTLRAEWAADSRHLVLLNFEGTGQTLIYLEVESGRARKVADVVSSQFEVGFSTDGKMIAYLGQSARSPGDVFLAAPGAPPRRLTDLNPQTLVDPARARPTDFVKATERVYHTPASASGIVVGVVPR